MIEALDKMIHEKELYARLKDGCKHAASQLSWDLLTEQMEGYYADVLAKRQCVANGSGILRGIMQAVPD